MAELEDIDRALADLHTGADRLGGLLLELELDGDRKLLDATTLKGATATAGPRSGTCSPPGSRTPS